MQECRDNILRLFNFCKVFLLPLVKRNMIVSNKSDVCLFPHKLPNDFTLRILGNFRKISKLQRNAQSFFQNESFFDYTETLLKTINATFPAFRYFA